MYTIFFPFVLMQRHQSLSICMETRPCISARTSIIAHCGGFHDTLLCNQCIYDRKNPQSYQVHPSVFLNPQMTGRMAQACILLQVCIGFCIWMLSTAGRAVKSIERSLPLLKVTTSYKLISVECLSVDFTQLQCAWDNKQIHCTMVNYSPILSYWKPPF